MMCNALKNKKQNLNDRLEHKRSFLHVGWFVDCGSASVCSADMQGSVLSVGRQL